jgi:hypothetical protein
VEPLTASRQRLCLTCVFALAQRPRLGCLGGGLGPDGCLLLVTVFVLLHRPPEAALIGSDQLDLLCSLSAALLARRNAALIPGRRCASPRRGSPPAAKCSRCVRGAATGASEAGNLGAPFAPVSKRSRLAARSSHSTLLQPPVSARPFRSLQAAAAGHSRISTYSCVGRRAYPVPSTNACGTAVATQPPLREALCIVACSVALSAAPHTGCGLCLGAATSSGAATSFRSAGRGSEGGG